MPTFRPQRADFLQVGRGFLMGGADIVPGVSGGTIALILGIYERLVGAISRVDTKALSMLRRGRLGEFAVHIDLRFLAFLGIGIGIGIVGLASTMHHLLEHELQPTLAAFFGMILASTLVVARMIGKRSAGVFASALLGFLFALWLVGLPFLQQPPQGPLYTFFCGALAICAMILPGISGAFILLILGKYFDVTGVLKGLSSMHIDGDGVITLVSFGLGAGLGIISFSKLLKVLLARFHATTMAVLAGFMLGSLRKIWPYKQDLTLGEEKFKLKQFENIVPDLGEASTWWAIGIAVIAAGLVLGLEVWSNHTDGTGQVTQRSEHDRA